MFLARASISYYYTLNLPGSREGNNAILISDINLLWQTRNSWLSNFRSTFRPSTGDFDIICELFRYSPISLRNACFIYAKWFRISIIRLLFTIIHKYLDGTFITAQYQYYQSADYERVCDLNVHIQFGSRKREFWNNILFEHCILLKLLGW